MTIRIPYMRNRTHESDFLPFFSIPGRSWTSFPEAARVRFRQRAGSVLGLCTGTISREADLFKACCRRRLPGGDSLPPHKEAELTYHGFFLGEETRVHVFVFLSCPFPFESL